MMGIGNCSRPVTADNASFQNAVAHQWLLGGELRVVAVNLSNQPVEFFLPLPNAFLAGQDWRLLDVLNNAEYVRSGDELLSPGLYVVLQGFGCHLFEFTPHKL